MSAFEDLDEEVDAIERSLRAQMGTWRRRAEAAEAERNRLRARVASLEAAARWIPVTERLPEEGVGVLAYGAAEYVTAWWDGRHFRDPHSLFEGITHWRPIPWPEVQPTLDIDPGGRITLNLESVCAPGAPRPDAPSTSP